jgi:adenylosuccinate lyase
VDPALVLLLREALGLILKELSALRQVIRNQAAKHKWTLMSGLTHRQDAEPTTFGHLLLVYDEAVARSIHRIRNVLNTELREGKISGIVGTHAGMNPELERKALAYLGLKPAKAETQILQRDRHAAVVAALAIAAATIEEMALTFCEMAGSRRREIQEPRTQNQRGSSAAAGKRNPIELEKLKGLPRVLRGYLNAALENVATPDFRDISQSSVERHILPDTTALLHYMVNIMTGVVQNLVVFPERMKRNLLEDSFGTWAGQRIRIALMQAGVTYHTAYLYIQKASFDAVDKGVSLIEILQERSLSEEDSRTAAMILGLEPLLALFDPLPYIRRGIEEIFKRCGVEIRG